MGDICGAWMVAFFGAWLLRSVISELLNTLAVNLIFWAAGHHQWCYGHGSAFQATGDAVNLIHIWDPATCQRIHTFRGHKKQVSVSGFFTSTNDRLWV